jgi:hypothetical protein
MSDTFATYGAPEAGPCCQSLTTSMPASDITVTSPASFEMVFRRDVGGALDSFWDLAADPTRLYDLAGKPASELRGLVHSSIVSGGLLYVSGQNNRGPKLDLLEATPARVRVRSETFYQRRPSSGSNAVLGGLKGIADYTISPAGKLGVRWNRRVTASVAYTDHPIEISAHQAVPADPRSSLVGYSQSVPTLQPFRVRELTTSRSPLQTPPGRARTSSACSTATGRPPISSPSRAASHSSAGGTPPHDPDPGGQPSDNWDLLVSFKPTNLLSDVDPAVTSRSSITIPSTIDVLTASRGSRPARTPVGVTTSTRPKPPTR